MKLSVTQFSMLALVALALVPSAHAMGKKRGAIDGQGLSPQECRAKVMSMLGEVTTNVSPAIKKSVVGTRINSKDESGEKACQVDLTLGQAEGQPSRGSVYVKSELQLDPFQGVSIDSEAASLGSQTTDWSCVGNETAVRVEHSYRQTSGWHHSHDVGLTLKRNGDQTDLYYSLDGDETACGGALSDRE